VRSKTGEVEVEDGREFMFSWAGALRLDCVSMHRRTKGLPRFAAGTKPAAVQTQAQAFLACGGGSLKTQIVTCIPVVLMDPCMA
jgi:hypothetical protein